MNWNRIRKCARGSRKIIIILIPLITALGFRNYFRARTARSKKIYLALSVTIFYENQVERRCANAITKCIKKNKRRNVLERAACINGRATAASLWLKHDSTRHTTVDRWLMNSEISFKYLKQQQNTLRNTVHCRTRWPTVLYYTYVNIKNTRPLRNGYEFFLLFSFTKLHEIYRYLSLPRPLRSWISCLAIGLVIFYPEKDRLHTDELIYFRLSRLLRISITSSSSSSSSISLASDHKWPWIGLNIFLNFLYLTQKEKTKQSLVCCWLGL
jgi:hypothetical protein